MKKLLLISLCLLTSCGFTPVYGTHTNAKGGSVANLMNQVSIDRIPDHQGQILRNDLIDRMYGKGRPEKPLYTLHVDLVMSISDLGIQADSTSTRSLLDLTANYALSDARTGKLLVNGSAHSISSYNKLLNQYGTLAANEDAIQRTTNEVGEQIVNRLNMFFAEGPQIDPNADPVDIKPETTSPAAAASGNPAMPSALPNYSPERLFQNE